MLNKQAIDVSFAEGLDTKTDPKRVKVGKFVKLENTVFNKGGQLQKRNGYPALPSLPDTSYSYSTTFNGNLTAIGSNIAAYNSGGHSWVQRGAIQPASVNTLPVIRNNFNQAACDIAIAPNGVACAVYLEYNAAVTTARYVIFDSVTGQNIKAPADIPVTSGTVTGGLRVFVLGNNFILVFTNVITVTNHLQYVAISTQNPALVGTNTDIASTYTPASTVSWDGAVYGNYLYLAYNTTSGGQSIKVTSLSVGLILTTARTFAGQIATMVSVTVDITNPVIPVIYVSYYDSASTNGHTLAVDINLNTLMAPQQIITSSAALNIASAAQNGVCSVVYEVSNTYGFSPGTGNQTNYINYITVTLATTVVTAPHIRVLSVGLASKAFIIDGIIYVLSAYQSLYQSTYFLINVSESLFEAPVIVAKLAYSNGGGYLPTGLPSVTVTNKTAQMGYLFKDLIEAVNKGTALPTGSQTAGIYSQTGINLASFTIGTGGLDTSEIGNDLHLSGGFLWMYDGYLPVEHNFFLWPDVAPTSPPNPVNTSVAVWTENSVKTPTGTFANGGRTVTVSSAAGISVGMSITDTTNVGYIPANTFITNVNGNVLTISNATTHAGAGDSLSIQGNIVSKPDSSTNTDAYYYQFTYEWTDNQGNAFRSAPSIPIAVTTTGTVTTGIITLTVPTLRLTMKYTNPIKIVVYRWSVAQQQYYQVTSIANPLLNSTYMDYVSFVDTLPDATILGNNLIYTTGGVIEDVNAPASDLLSIFDTRLWLVDAEDRNLLWFSKQVIEATPVEMSDLLTKFIPPTVANATGEITSIHPLDDKLIISKGGNSFVYINGSGPDNTGANNQYSDAIFITSTVGCSNQKSMAVIPNGLIFQSNKGIWLLGRGLDTSYIGAPVEDFTTGATVNSAVVVPETNQVRFTLDTGITLMYDYYYDQWSTFKGVPCVSSCIFEGMHTFINSYGAVHQELADSYLDGSNPVLMAFKTGPLRLGDLQNYQRAYFFYLLGTYISPHKLQVLITYDYDVAPSQSILISPTNYSTPLGTGLSQSPLGQGSPFGGPKNLESWQVFLERQRCMAFAIEIQEVFDASLGTVAGAGLTLSGLNLILGFKRGYRPQPTVHSAG